MRDSVALILARGGSTRIHRKNVREFLGKPMVCWPVETATNSNLFERVIISTEDAEIAARAMEAGAEWPFKRPARLADNYSRAVEVLRYVLGQYREYAHKIPKFCCVLYGTSVFVTPHMLIKAHDMLQDAKNTLIMAVIPYSSPIQRALQRDEQGNFFYWMPDFVNRRTQDIPPSYYDAGQFYYFNAREFMDADEPFIELTKKAIILSPLEATDIDNEEDWARAEMIAARMKKINNQDQSNE